MSETSETFICSGQDCGKETQSTLKCPVCLKQDIVSVFCSQSCFRKNWANHKFIHKQEGKDHYDPFPDFKYTGDLRPFYPLTPRRAVPNTIKKPEWASTGVPAIEIKEARSRNLPPIEGDELKRYKIVCQLGREVLDAAASMAKPGVTTDEIDELVHRETIKRKAYPSPLNYYNFPKSCCTSVNEIVCHGIPDKRPLQDGDILNIDISLYKDGFHTDLNETYYIGDKAKCNKEVVNLVETTRECLQLAIDAIKPGVPVRNFGNIIEKHAKENNCQVVRTYCGHGTGRYFHCFPDVPHYAKNKTAGICKPGMVFTIEPMITAGTFREVRWPDDWTSATLDGKYTAQFEHTLLVTETGCEVLTARFKSSPGGPIKRL